MIRRFSLLGKINIIVALVFLFVTAVETIVNTITERESYLKFAEEQVTDITTWYFDSLNTMMLTGTMNERSILREKLLARWQVTDARVIRGEPVKQQFGVGFPEEQPVDQYDTKALKGESSAFVSDGPEGRQLTVITPFKATENTRGVNCLRCHDVASGAVNGAVRVSYSLAHLDIEIKSQTIRKLVTNLVLFGIGMILVNFMLIRWFSKPIKNLMEVVQKRARGDIAARVHIESQDELGRLGEAFNTMAENVNAVADREHTTAEELQQKVDQLLSVMKRVTEGDFSVKVGFSGDGAIGELASSLQIMIDDLKKSLDEKHAAVETLKYKVDKILSVTQHVSDGDLTRSVNIEGVDAIAHLGQGVQGMVESLSSLVAQIQQSGSLVTESTAELAECMGQVELTASQQASATSDISVTATEISSTTNELLGTMNEVASMADNATNSAIHSEAGLKKLEILMGHVIRSAALVAEKLEILDERATNINAVVTTIGSVADQTNLLSLNAAIEAEKAGEYGRGFAVVATEIRRLADQAAISTLDIEQMINEMQDSVSSSVETMKQFTVEVRESVEEVQSVSKEQSEIINQVETMGPRFEALHQAMQFQSQGAEQIHLAMLKLNTEAQNTVDSLKLSSQTIRDLEQSAESLQNSVSKFKVSSKD
ncbi:MAG: methyl-accepting chemotaxis protein [Gammaproteobacteria bacterium]|nr:methyl-accepting chemotaxis protein [Gammaproteobacteria bacterium]